MPQLNNRPGKEDGATLIVALVMLILISLIGVTSLKNATVTEKMSSAEHQKNITFQASESAATVVLRNELNISNAIISDGPIDAQPYDIGSTVTNTQVTLAPVGVGSLLGASLGPGGVAAQRIMVTATAQIAANPQSKSGVIHGVVVLAPRL